jgi:hypothetical protein
VTTQLSNGLLGPRVTTAYHVSFPRVRYKGEKERTVGPGEDVGAPLPEVAAYVLKRRSYGDVNFAVAVDVTQPKRVAKPETILWVRSVKRE